MGLLSKFPINNICTHIFDKDKPGSKSYIQQELPEVEIEIATNKSLFILCNHFKSKGYSASQATLYARRKLQANRVKDILKNNFNSKIDLVMISGDFNDTPDSKL